MKGATTMTEPRTSAGKRLAEWLTWATDRQFSGIPRTTTVTLIEAEARTAALAEVEEAVKGAAGSYWYRINPEDPSAPMVELVPLADVLAAIQSLQGESR